MSRACKIALVSAVILLFAMSLSLAWSAPQSADAQKLPVFSAQDRQIIESYYNLLLGTLAPGSINRSAFPWCRERVGSELSRADAA